MPTSKVYIVTDLGPGDGGKGGVVHKLCTLRKPHTVIKVGGSQGSHGVRTFRGQSFNFSFFGCGTLEGTRTHISRNMVFDPMGLIHEGRLLRYTCGSENIFDLMTVDEDAVCSTPFHTMSTQLRELARRDNPRGTIGTGVGEAYEDASRYPLLSIVAGDLCRSDLRDMLEEIRRQKIQDLQSILEAGPECFLPADRETAQELTKMFLNERFSKETAKRFQEMHSLVKVVAYDYLRSTILAREGVAVVESSHGVLTDKFFGFYPHTSKLRTIPQMTFSMLVDDCGYTGEIVHLGVTRAYSIRHGAGPMPTEDSIMLETLLPGSHKEENRWQGKVRVGPLDTVLLRYAIEVCGGPHVFDGIALTWFDQIEKNGIWRICTDYGDMHSGFPLFFNLKGDLYVNWFYVVDDDQHFQKMEELGTILQGVKPHIMEYRVRDLAMKDRIALAQNVVHTLTRVPARMISLGPTERDKVLC